ncbi:hypothetical protein [Sphingomonas sp.]|jgi:hypothetical protein|uniref:hypothetical protein n=1 Tax=Sphingomonas sp. TaxID=28214 RepID=UPI002D7F8B6F|nr:hypothetical protein [Sphingomonas sp.]HEU0044083.1 hypothetical protein [Sphingomonas sp.]
MSMILAMLLQAGAVPAPEAEALGLRLARTGTLAALLPMMGASETAELIKQNPELAQTEQAALRETAAATLEQGMARLMKAEGRAYASALSVDDLRALVAFAESAPARRQRAVMPKVIAGTMAAAGAFDFKQEVRAAFCTRAGKLCGEKK